MRTRRFPFSLPLIFESLATIGLGLLLIGTLERATIPLFNWFGYYLVITKSIEIVSYFVYRNFPPLMDAYRDVIFLLIGALLIQLNNDVLLLIFRLSNFLVDARVTILFFSTSILLIALMGFVQTARGGGWSSALVGVLSLFFGISTLSVNSVALDQLFYVIGIGTLLAGILGLVAAFFDRHEGMSPVVAVFRLIGIFLILLRSLGFAFIGWITPFKWRGLPIHYWIIQQMCTTILRILNIRLTVEDADKIRQHHGIVFVNHLSYLDILILLAASPGRFLSTAEVFTVPLLGLTASSINTVFVRREKGAQRSSVRELIADSVEQSAHPPFFIFPEGKFGEPKRVAPFRYGSFEIVSENSIPYLLCALGYEPADVVRWRGKHEESFARAIWRLLRYRHEMGAWLRPLITITPAPADDPIQLAQAAEHTINAALNAAHPD